MEPEGNRQAERGQVSTDAAEVYDAFFVPALFAEWAPRLLDAAGAGPGDRVLDVGCGTGVVAREAQARVGDGGEVVGVDVNPGMLAVARNRAPGVRWREGAAEALPFEDASFDRVACQFGLMFFVDRRAAIREMRRVTRPGGKVAVAVWGPVEATPGYAAMVALLERLFGRREANALRAPYCLGDVQALASLFADAGVPNARVETQLGTARFPSLDAWVHTDVRGWTLADLIDDAGFERLRTEAHGALSEFVEPTGEVAFDAPAHLVTFAVD